MADLHITRRINLLSDRRVTAVIFAGRLIECRGVRFIAGKNIASVTVGTVCQVDQLIADALQIGGNRATVVITQGAIARIDDFILSRLQCGGHLTQNALFQPYSLGGKRAGQGVLAVLRLRLGQHHGLRGRDRIVRRTVNAFTGGHLLTVTQPLALGIGDPAHVLLIHHLGANTHR